MTDGQAPGGERQFYNLNGPAEEALQHGAAVEHIDGRLEEIVGAREILGVRAVRVEADYQAELRRVDEEYQTAKHEVAQEFGHLETETQKLHDEQAELRKRAGEDPEVLRKLAVERGAERINKLAYVALRDGDLTPSGLGRLDDLDSAVRDNDGEVFVAVQGAHVAFGRLEDNNKGLRLDLALRPNVLGAQDQRLHVPVQKYPSPGTAKQAKRHLWVSGDFDHKWHQDTILRRDRESDEVIDSTLSNSPCRVNVSNCDVPIATPLKMEVATDAATIEAAINENPNNNALLTGDAALAYLHRFVGARLEYIANQVDSHTAMHEFARLLLQAADVEISLDPKEIPHLRQLSRV